MEKRKKMILSIFSIMTVVLLGIVSYYWYQNTFYVKTDDARVAGDIVKVSPQISGKLLELDVSEGDKVFKEQIVGRQEAISLSDANLDQSVLRAPIDGIVIKKSGNVGEIVSAGQTIAMIIDPNKLYINANIEETKLGRIRQGQIVDITIDQYKGKRFTGKVKFVGEAANSAFSLLPSSTSGTFTKVVQKIPVKIELDKSDSNLLPGTNAVIKIHIK